MNKEKSEYEQDLEIDKYALDTECMEQPQKFIKWSERLAETTAERDRADQKVEVTKARLEKEMRSNPAYYGLEKATDAAVKAAVIAHKDTQQAIEEWIDAKYRMSILFAAKEGMEQKRSMLENLIKLFLSGYWADPKLPKEAKEALANEGTEKQKALLNKKLLKKG